MRPDDDRCWDISRARDARYDGAFVVGVRTTGVYCRPSCPGRPLRRNVAFFDDVAGARRAGLRACLRCAPDAAAGEWVTRDLAPRAPFDGTALLAYLGARAVPGVEEVDGGVYRRSLGLAGGPAVAELALGPDRAHARLRLADPSDLSEALGLLRALTGADADPAAVLDGLGGDALLGPLVRARPGLRAPGATDGAELAIRAVLGQQVSLAAARTLAGRLVERCGKPLARPVGEVRALFPTPRSIARLDPEALAMPRSRGTAVRTLARALAREELELRPDADPAAARAALLALPGIGPWTAGYVALRALGDPDAFPTGDLGVRHAVAARGGPAGDRAITALAESWRPWRAYATHHLWASLSGV